MEHTERDLLEAELRAGKLMQLSTLDADGHPRLCHVWYNPSFSPDRLCFISSKDRNHSINIRNNPNVAGGIIVNAPEGLGKKVRGITFVGQAEEIPLRRIGHALKEFLIRWPNASEAITLDRLTKGATKTRLYEVRVTEWLLFDEVNFPEDPRRVIPASTD